MCISLVLFYGVFLLFVSLYPCVVSQKSASPVLGAEAANIGRIIRASLGRIIGASLTYTISALNKLSLGKSSRPSL